MEKEEQVLRVKNLEIGFKREADQVMALRGMSFSLSKGKVVGVVGESGCGKSVLALSIMGLLDKEQAVIHQGEIWLKEQSLLNLKEKEYEKLRGNEMAMIFQEPMTSLNPVMPVGKQIGEVLKIHKGLKGKENSKKVIEMLQAVHILEPERVSKAYPHELSGGMRQRVMIAMALCSAPDLLIADEPTTALDVTIQAQILSLLKELNEVWGTTIMFITHDLGVIAEIADEVMVLYAGEIVEQATTEELFDRPKHPYTQGLLNSRPSMAQEGYIPSITGNVPALENMPSGCAFAPRCEYAKPQCSSEAAEWTALTSTQGVRCWRYMEGGSM